MRQSNLVTGLFAVLFALIGDPVSAVEPDASDWEGIEKMMSAEEFTAAGLGKLSREELLELNEWFLKFLAHDSQQVVNTDETIRELQKTPVRRRITGKFKGWDGDTVFRLDNGEIWKQRLPGRYAISLDNPEVEIFKNFLGFYELRILKTGRRIGVTRLK